MSIAAEPFDASKLSLPEIQSFECGNHAWCLHASIWIKESDPKKGGAIGSMAKYGTEVWLYRLISDRTLIGFCGLGKTKWKIDGVTTEVSIIPQFAIQSAFQGQGLSYQIISDILARALDHGTPYVVLEVHELNHAINIYRKFRFKELPTRRRSDHISMSRVNREPVEHQQSLF
ncbi:MAG: GNAT family N-acetyltransferase [Patescibacteria group bacterium]|nr:GNAT family N-acetyltransferase [Patescibacteria group bacterium]